MGDRCVYGAPSAYGRRGAPAKHEHKMKLNAPETWSVPSQSVEVEDAKLGRVQVTRWSQYQTLREKLQWAGARVRYSNNHRN